MEKHTYPTKKEILTTLRGKSPHERFLHRLHCVALMLNGSSASGVARIYGDSPRAVAYWATQFKRSGFSGLEEEQRPGRPTILTRAQMKILQTFIRRTPEATPASLASHILKEFKISVNPNLAWRFLKKLSK